MTKVEIIRDICLEILNDKHMSISASLILDVIERLEKHGFKFGDAEKLKPVVSEKHTILDDDVFEFLCSHLNINGHYALDRFTLGNRDGNHRTFYKRSSEKAQGILADQADAEHSNTHKAKPSMTKAEAYIKVEKLCGREMGRGNIVDVLESLGLLTFEQAQTQEPSEPVLDVLKRVLRSFGVNDPHLVARECYKALYVASYRIVDKP